MPNLSDALKAAKKKPSNRTAYEQGLVDSNNGSQQVRNADFDAGEAEKTYGK